MHDTHTQSGAPQAHGTNKLKWTVAEAGRAGLGVLAARPPPWFPCPVLGNSTAHMTQGEGFWNSPRRNCIILTNDPFPPQEIKSQGLLV